MKYKFQTEISYFHIKIAKFELKIKNKKSN